MDRHPAAYLRRSFVDVNSPGDISREAQRATVRRLAVADGHNGNLVEYDDFGKSADILKSARRTAYTRLLADMEAGRVSAVYAFDVDRLYRDPRDLIRLQDAAQRHRVTIATTAGRLAIGDGDDPSAEAFAFIGAVFGRLELQKAKKRSRAGLAARKARGDTLGKPGYGWRTVKDAAGNLIRGDGGRVLRELNPDEPLEPILAAYREAGTFSGAARLLNARGVPARLAKSWSGNTVRRIVRRKVDLPRAASRAGRRPQPARLAGLLRCPCGNLMTARTSETITPYGRYGPYTGYQCPRGRYQPDHPRPYMVAEAAILPAVKAAAAKLRPPETVPAEVPDREAERQELLTRRARIIDNYEDGLYDKAERDRRLGVVVEALEALEQLEEAEAALPVPPAIDWDEWTPEAINRVLRLLFVEFRLAPDLHDAVPERRPLRFWS